MNTDNNQSQMSFGARLKELRFHKKLSQAEMGKIIGVRSTHIGRYERGESKPTAKYLKLLADTLDVSTDYLYDGVEENAVVVDLKDRELLNMVAEVENFCEEDKRALKNILATYIKKNQHEQVSNQQLTTS